MRDEEKEERSSFIPHPSALIPSVVRSAVIVMVKAPRAGLVKTRLTPPLTAVDAASLAASLAQDVVNGARQTVDNLIIAYAPADGRATLEKFLRGDLFWLEQRGASLGDRLEHAAAQAFEQGFGPLVFLGADSPTLPPHFITRAINALAGASVDMTLGPTDDGGYYLVGLRHPARGIFKDIAWSTPQAYAQTVRNARQLGLRTLQLPCWYDVDTFADLERLRSEIYADEEARRRAPATYQWLKGRDEG